jgi:hypothetical protein
MNKNSTEEEFDIEVERFLNTYKDFERAAKKLTAIMDSMNKKRYQELKALSGESQRIYQFLIQMMDDTGQIKERCFGIRCMADKEKK